ncbi:hypothetical protein ACIBQ1_61040 [Nonomuraea sp. NPDC050153]|uniref:hypothetical protein n=1 Tax=Nonomuraea sp. NPDC050153 TaxID=3364359 RepID=UPI00378FEA71
MMPQLVTVRVKRPDRHPVRVWVPVLPVVLVFSPVVVVAVVGAVVGAVVACRMYRIDVVRALGTGWRIVCALPGTRFDAEYSRTAVLVAIR